MVIPIPPLVSLSKPARTPSMANTSTRDTTANVVARARNVARARSAPSPVAAATPIKMPAHPGRPVVHPGSGGSPHGSALIGNPWIAMAAPYAPNANSETCANENSPVYPSARFNAAMARK
jgi:hypothetical protein